eukprot:TRINITY_DN890_c0_g1_i5.p1 TRINITY_DN890_c0_g1~~TRINITY_DN890_c0_g1_i5.p1  ORF type:complete len:400 (-),score=59.49 TRINITY_DN890_c0_g1_i5:290-1489(-)
MQAEGFAWTPRACSAALLSCGEAGRLERALQLTREMRRCGVRPRDADNQMLISMCAPKRWSGHDSSRRGGSQRVLEVLQHMEDTGHPLEVKYFDIGIAACGRAGDCDTAFRVFQQIRKKGVKANTASWNALIDAIGRAGRVDDMLETYKKMRATGQRPDTVTINCMISHAGDTEDCRVAEELWNEMNKLQLEPNTMTHNALIGCYAKAGRPDKAEELLAKMRKSKKTPADYRTFNRTMTAYKRAGRLDEAACIIERMRAAKVEPTNDTWQQIIDAVTAAGDEHKADTLYANALTTGAFHPYQKQTTYAGIQLTDGTAMDLIRLNGSTAQAAVRRELRLRQEKLRVSRRQRPLYIITGVGHGLLLAAVSKTLASQGIQYSCPEGRGIIVVPPGQPQASLA